MQQKDEKEGEEDEEDKKSASVFGRPAPLKPLPVKVYSCRVYFVVICTVSHERAPFCLLPTNFLNFWQQLNPPLSTPLVIRL